MRSTKFWTETSTMFTSLAPFFLTRVYQGLQIVSLGKVFLALMWRQIPLSTSCTSFVSILCLNFDVSLTCSLFFQHFCFTTLCFTHINFTVELCDKSSSGIKFLEHLTNALYWGSLFQKRWTFTSKLCRLIVNLQHIVCGVLNQRFSRLGIRITLVRRSESLINSL